MQTTNKQTDAPTAPAVPTAAEVMSTSAAPRVLNAAELAAVTGAKAATKSLAIQNLG